ncbi:MAG: sigma-70 family RNA polymerase sigma factor [Armatimonadetes bacterium]|nr:sigma-70 family RNA polymerase sigma factor [Armatimonadota bacterium]MDW8121262.1 sigma-70 family RNA polymerase sigma factor [Armatimonadota bacterium]
MGTTSITDAQLVHKAKGGDQSAFEELMRRYARRVWTLSYRLLRNREDAEDVTQETFLSALEHLKDLRDEDRFGPWLAQIASRLSLRLLDHRRRSPTQSLEGLTSEVHDDENGGPIPHPEFIAEWRDDPETLLLRKETRDLVEEALNSLPEKYRAVFLLRDVEGLSVKETAQALNISETNVKVRLLRARLQLREKLTRLFGDEATRRMPHHHHDADPNLGGF